LPNGVTVPIGSLEDKKAKIAEQQKEAKKKRDDKRAAKQNNNTKKTVEEEGDSDVDGEENVEDEEKSENDDEDNDLINANLYNLRAFNEYIVYDTSQVRMRYLIQLKRK